MYFISVFVGQTLVKYVRTYMFLLSYLAIYSYVATTLGLETLDVLLSFCTQYESQLFILHLGKKTNSMGRICWVYVVKEDLPSVWLSRFKHAIRDQLLIRQHLRMLITTEDFIPSLFSISTEKTRVDI